MTRQRSRNPMTVLRRDQELEHATFRIEKIFFTSALVNATGCSANTLTEPRSTPPSPLPEGEEARGTAGEGIPDVLIFSCPNRGQLLKGSPYMAEDIRSLPSAA